VLAGLRGRAHQGGRDRRARSERLHGSRERESFAWVSMDAVKGKKPVSRDNIGMTRLDTRRAGALAR
jgi:hypothetical protein